MEKLTEKESKILREGKCPDCGKQLYKGPRGGLAINVQCENGHTFWVAPLFTPERITPKPANPLLEATA